MSLDKGCKQQSNNYIPKSYFHSHTLLVFVLHVNYQKLGKTNHITCCYNILLKFYFLKFFPWYICVGVAIPPFPVPFSLPIFPSCHFPNIIITVVSFIRMSCKFYLLLFKYIMTYIAGIDKQNI